MLVCENHSLFHSYYIGYSIYNPLLIVTSLPIAIVLINIKKNQWARCLDDVILQKNCKRSFLYRSTKIQVQIAVTNFWPTSSLPQLGCHNLEATTCEPQLGTITWEPQLGTITWGPQLGTITWGPQLGTITWGPQLGDQLECHNLVANFVVTT